MKENEYQVQALSAEVRRLEKLAAAKSDIEASDAAVLQKLNQELLGKRTEVIDISASIANRARYYFSPSPTRTEIFFGLIDTRGKLTARLKLIDVILSKAKKLLGIPKFWPVFKTTHQQYEIVLVDGHRLEKFVAREENYEAHEFAIGGQKLSVINSTKSFLLKVKRYSKSPMEQSISLLLKLSVHQVEIQMVVKLKNRYLLLETLSPSLVSWIRLES